MDLRRGKFSRSVTWAVLISFVANLVLPVFLNGRLELGDKKNIAYAQDGQQTFTKVKKASTSPGSTAIYDEIIHKFTQDGKQKEVVWRKNPKNLFMFRGSNPNNRQQVETYWPRDQVLRHSKYSSIVDGKFVEAGLPGPELTMIVQNDQVLGVVYQAVTITGGSTSFDPIIGLLPGPNLVSFLGGLFGKMKVDELQTYFGRRNSENSWPSNRSNDTLGALYLCRTGDDDSCGAYNAPTSSVWEVVYFNRDIYFGDVKDTPSNADVKNYADTFKDLIQGSKFPVTLNGAKASGKLQEVIDKCEKEFGIALDGQKGPIGPDDPLPEDLGAYINETAIHDPKNPNIKASDVLYQPETELKELYNNFYKVNDKNSHIYQSSNAAWQQYFEFGTSISSFYSNMMGDAGGDVARIGFGIGVVALSLIPVAKGAVAAQGASKGAAATKAAEATANVTKAKEAVTAAEAGTTGALANVAKAEEALAAAKAGKAGSILDAAGKPIVAVDAAEVAAAEKALEAAQAAGKIADDAGPAAIEAAKKAVKAAEKVETKAVKAADRTSGKAAGAAAMAKGGLSVKQLIIDLSGFGLGYAIGDQYIKALNNSDNAKIKSNLFKQAIARYYIERHMDVHKCVVENSKGISADELKNTEFTQAVLDKEMKAYTQFLGEGVENEELADDAQTGASNDPNKGCPINTVPLIGSALCSVLGLIIQATATLAYWATFKLFLPALSLTQGTSTPETGEGIGFPASGGGGAAVTTPDSTDSTDNKAGNQSDANKTNSDSSPSGKITQPAGAKSSATDAAAALTTTTNKGKAE